MEREFWAHLFQLAAADPPLREFVSTALELDLSIVQGASSQEVLAEFGRLGGLVLQVNLQAAEVAVLFRAATEGSLALFEAVAEGRCHVAPGQLRAALAAWWRGDVERFLQATRFMG